MLSFNVASNVFKSCVLAKRTGTRGFVYASTAENSNWLSGFKNTSKLLLPVSCPCSFSLKLLCFLLQTRFHSIHNNNNKMTLIAMCSGGSELSLRN